MKQIFINTREAKRVANFATEGDSILLPCTDSSGSTQVEFPELGDDSASSDVMITNAGSNPAWVAFGDSTITAAIPAAGVPANGICIPGGAIMVLYKGFATHAVGICASGLTADLYISQGYGS